MNEPFIGSAVNDALAVMINEVTLALNEKVMVKNIHPKKWAKCGWMNKEKVKLSKC